MRLFTAITLAVLAVSLFIVFDIAILCERTFISMLFFMAGSAAAFGSRHYFTVQQQYERIERKAA